jgi:antitoxin HigA-1
MLPRNRPPTTPGEVLVEEFLKPLEVTQLGLAERMGVPVQRINTMINGKRGVTADTAIRLARVLKTTPEFWMNLQTAYDLWTAEQRLEREPARIPPPRRATSKRRSARQGRRPNGSS